MYYLEDIQLLQERQRLAELEYFFKHALTQEVTYDSILLKRRKELHVQIAAAIECIFCDRLSDFYDMLALHYNQGEHLVLHYDFKISSVMNSPGFSLGISRHRQPFPPEQRIFFLQNLWDPI